MTTARTSPATRTEAPGLDRQLADRNAILDAIALGLHKTRTGNDAPEFDMDKADDRAEAIWEYVMPVLDRIDEVTLDEAWRAVERVISTFGAAPSMGVSLRHGEPAFYAWAETFDGSTRDAEATGATPAAALQALRDKLVAG